MKSTRRPVVSPPRTFYVIKQLESAVRSSLEAALREFSLTVAQYTTMNRLRSREGASASQLARAHHVSPQTMNELVTELEERGLVRRKEAPDNRRVLLVSLTKDGLALLIDADRKVDALEATFFSCLSVADQDALRELAAKVVAHVRRAPLS
jgi:DNA-binding MarR family transcriptional regulator